MADESDKTSNVRLMPAHANMTPEECLAYVAKERWSKMLVIGYHEDDPGFVVIRSSAMTRETALWLANHAAMNALSVKQS